jgi:hypothetical protein
MLGLPQLIRRSLISTAFLEFAQVRRSADDSHLTKEAAREINFEGSGVLRMSTEPFDLMHRPSKLYFFQAAPLVRALSPFVCHSP